MTLMFVYNADSGLFNLASDMAHKLLSPSTYACRLCALTHGHLGMREKWRGYLDSLPVALEFLHRDEFRTRFGREDIALPAILRADGDAIAVWLSAEAINSAANLDELMMMIDARLALRR